LDDFILEIRWYPVRFYDYTFSQNLDSGPGPSRNLIEEIKMSIRQMLSIFYRWLMLGERKGIRRSILGKGNIFQANDSIITNMELDIVGDNNVIVIGKGSRFNNVHFRVRGNGHHIDFGPECKVTRAGIFWIEDEGCILQVGQKTSMVDVHIAVTEPGSMVKIGEDCMFANDIDIRTGDSHSIIDPETGDRLNQAADVIIDNHVWVAPHVVILKGVHIGENSVVATGSVVTKSGGSGLIFGGNPAVEIKSGISWKRERLPR
jgi:acetyltransferase-like isoleucine patch superfamily enzyme